MSFFGNLWDAAKSGFGAIGSTIGKLAPMAGTALGGVFGGPGGAMMGSQLGNMVSGIMGGGGGEQPQQQQAPQSVGQAFSGMGNMAGQGMQNMMQQRGMQMPSWAQNSTGGNFLQNAGQHFGGRAAEMASRYLPQSFQQYAPQLQQFGQSMGSKLGGMGQQKFNSYVPERMQHLQDQQLSQMPSAMGRYAGSQAYNRTGMGRQQAAENMEGFDELPQGGYAHGGQVMMPHHGHTAPNLREMMELMQLMQQQGGGMMPQSGGMQ